MDEDVAGQASGTSTWSDATTRASLQVLAEGAAKLAGFHEAAVSVRRGDALEVVAAFGLGTEELIGTQLDINVFQAELDHADHWGTLRFVPSERVGAEVLAYSHLADHPVLQAPDAWHPMDLLTAPLLDDEGVIRGLLSVDSPVDGHRPGEAQRAALMSYAGVARTQVLLALQREELQERVRLAHEVRTLIRAALGEDSLDQVVEVTRRTVTASFDAVGMWMSAFETGGGAATTWWSHYGYELPRFAELDALAVRLGHLCWGRQEVVHFTPETTDHPGLSAADATLVADFLASVRITSALFVPLGAGSQCLGYLVLARRSDGEPWNEVEASAALDIGHDLGLAIANAHQMEQQRGLVDRLRELDRYRTELMNTVAHELRNPLTSVSGYLELIEDADLSVDVRRSVEAASRGAARLESLVDDLRSVAQVSDPDTEFDPVEVDLGEIVPAVVEECALAAAAKSVIVTTEVSAGPHLVLGVAEKLHQLLANLGSNAVKYSHDGASVLISLTRDEDEVVVQVVDQGLGISEEDQGSLFQEFFRSSNPDARSRPGTGLGLVIADRIVRRHSGVIGLSSELGRGTVVTVRLPAAP